MVGDRPEQQRRGHRGQDQRGDVELALAVAELGELAGEREREQEPEEHLDAQAGYPQFLEQFGQVAVVAFGLGLVARVLGLVARVHRTHDPTPAWRTT